MLYYTFREVIEELESSLENLIRSSTPSPDEWTEDAKNYLPMLNESLAAVKQAKEVMPGELVDFKDRRFGPRIAQQDIKSILDTVGPLASDDKLPKAIYSYNPAKLYRNGVHFLSCVIELYWGFQKYNLGQYKTQPGQIDAMLPPPENDSTVFDLASLLKVQAGFVDGLNKGADWDFGEDRAKF